MLLHAARYCSTVGMLALVLNACASAPATTTSEPTTIPTAAPTAPIEIPGITDSFTPSDPAEQNIRLGRGMNMGNMLEAPQEGEWGLTVQDEYFNLIRDAGFNHVRIPIRWSAHAATTAPYAIDPAFLARVDHVVQQALSQKLLVIINVHHYDELMSNPAAQETRFLAIWQQLSEHYQHYSGDLLFELINEPHGALGGETLNQLYVKTLAVVRKTNPTRTIVVGPMNYFAIDGLDDLTLPKDDTHLIVSIHYYNPFRFTHQGADWVSDSGPWLGTTWTATKSEQFGVTSEFDLARSWARNNKRPMYLGEFGAYSKADLDSRVRWTSFVARYAEKTKMSWAYWEFASGFGAYDPEQKAWRNPLLNALVPKD